MPSSAVLTFTDFDDYARRIRATTAEMTVIGRGHFAAKLVRIDLHRLWMQRFSDKLPRIVHSANVAGRAIITFRTQPGPSVLWNGVEVQPTSTTRHNERHETHHLSSGLACCGAMSLPVEDMASVGAAMAGCDLAPPRNTDRHTPTSRDGEAPTAACGRRHLAEEAPEIIADPDAARGLEQALIEAMVECLNSGEVSEDRSAQRRHAMILRRFRSVVEENSDQPL
jgi:hypothetical protein